MIRRLLILLALLTGGAASAEERAGTLEYPVLEAKAISTRGLTVWLPEGYQESNARYPVLYMHDGQNLFDDGREGAPKRWEVDKALSRLTASGEARPAIIVGIWSTDRRLAEYMPAKVAEALPEPYRTQLRELHKGASQSDAYLRYLVEELKPFIDRTYRTLPGKADTFIAGSSMGGLISLYAISEYPNVFGGAAAVSTHWPLFLTWPVEPRPAEEREAVTKTFEAWLDKALPSPADHKLYFDHGSETIDILYAPYQQRMDKVVERHGFVRGKNWLSLDFPGAAHEEGPWRERVHIPLRFLLNDDQGG